MNRSIRLARLLLAAAVATCAMTQAAHANPPVPTAIEVEDGHKKFLQAHAVGVQIYSCNGNAWAFVAPRADLYDRRGRLLGTHFAGPTWQAEDGSKVVGARVDGVNVDPTAIDWLLLSATPAAPGLLAATTFIQRVNTTGGLIPAAAACNASTVGTTSEVPYTADYYFWKARQGGKGVRD